MSRWLTAAPWMRRLLALLVVPGACMLAAVPAHGASRRPCGRDDRAGPSAARMRAGAPASPLVPHGAKLLTLCAYNGMNATASTPQFGLLGAAQTRGAATIRGITAELDALKPAHGVTNCPSDDAAAAVLSFSYGSADVVVDVGTNGCNQITSGTIHRLALGAPVVAQIEKLAKPVSGLKWATVVGHLRSRSRSASCWRRRDRGCGRAAPVGSR